MSEIPEGYIIVPTSAWHELVQYELKCQELAATVEALQEVIKERCLELKYDSVAGYALFLPDKLKKALNTTQQQHLAEIRAQAGRDGFVAGAGGFWHRDHDEYVPSEVRDAADHYAESIRQEVK